MNSIKIQFPSRNSVEDHILHKVFEKTLGRSLNGEIVEIEEDKFTKLKSKLNPDLLLDKEFGLSFVAKQRLLGKLDDSRMIKLNKNGKPTSQLDYLSIFSRERLDQEFKDLASRNNKKLTTAVKNFKYKSKFDNENKKIKQFCASILDQFRINQDLPSITCDTCGSSFPISALQDDISTKDELRKKQKLFHKIWKTGSKYTPGRLRRSINVPDRSLMYSNMGQSTTTNICPHCLWLDVIETVIIHELSLREEKFLAKYIFESDKVGESEDYFRAITYYLTGHIDDAFRNNFPDEDKIDAVRASDYNVITLLNYENDKPEGYILVLNCHELSIDQKTKSQREKLELNKYVDYSIRKKPEATYLYAMLLSIIKNWEIDNKKFSDIFTISPIEEVKLEDISLDEGRKILKLLYHVNSLAKMYFYNTSDKSSIRWRIVQSLIQNPFETPLKYIRKYFASLKPEKRNDVKQIFEKVENYMTNQKSIPKEMEFVDRFTEFLYNLPKKKGEELDDWSEINPKKGLGAYEKPLRLFFSIYQRHNKDMDSTIAEFATKLSRQGMDPYDDNTDELVEDFKSYASEVLPHVSPKKAKSLAFYTIFRKLKELNK